MGAAESSNVSQAVTNVSNFVSNSTTANDNQVDDVANSIQIQNCDIELSGDLNVHALANLGLTNTQIVNSKQDANLANNIQQQMLQEATSKIGFLGIGFAKASNSANEMVNATSTINNSINVSANQVSQVGETFTCDRSTIVADNINIGFYSNSDFLSSQTLSNTQTASIVNDISQSVSQKASATVEGLGGIIVALLLVAALIIYALGAPLSSGPAKIATSVAVMGGLVGVLAFMFIRNTPPFFSEPSNCINNSAIGMGKNDCVNLTNQKINLNSPPVKYIYGIIPGDKTKSGANLIQMAIAQISGQSKSDTGINGGYRVDTFLNLASKIKNYNTYAQKLGIPNIPNPLIAPTGSDGSYYQIPIQYINKQGQTQDGSSCTPITIQLDFTSTKSDLDGCPTVANAKAFTDTTTNPSQGVANLNLQNWKDYLNMTGSYTANNNNDNIETRELFARFVLCDIIGNIDLHHYVTGNEYIKFLDENNVPQISLAKDINGNPNFPNDTYFFHPNSGNGNWRDGLDSSGYIEGQIGDVNDRNYKLSNTMKTIGLPIITVIILAPILYMAYPYIVKKDQ